MAGLVLDKPRHALWQSVVGRQPAAWAGRRCLPTLFLSAGLGAACLLLAPISFGATVGDSSPALQADAVAFSKDIQPLLAKRCFSCHGPDAKEGGLRLDQQAGASAELESGGRAIVAGNIDKSLILERITSTDPDVQMPPEGKRLTTAQVAGIQKWIEQGAKWQEHWAFRPLKRPAPPTLAPHPIDAFVAAGLIRSGLAPAQQAAPIVLLRRATFDLTGLPPTPEEVRDFLADQSPDAWSKVVDRLLASQHYGEKWARHWLDLVRYADTNSFERDGAKPHSWRYRDYVIRSLNEDKPFDQFTMEQIAGDEMPEASPDAVIATGYYRLGLWDDEPADKLQARYDWLDDIVATTGQTFLGLTVNCARCHDHKIDPILQKDYYSLLSFFQNVTPMSNGGDQIERTVFGNDSERAEFTRQLADLQLRRNQAQIAVNEIESSFRTVWETQHANAAIGGDIDDLRFHFYRDTWTSLPDFESIRAEEEGVVASQQFDITIAPSLRPTDFGYVFRGFLKVPADGDYTFALDSDDGARLTIDGQTVIDHDGIHGEGSPKTGTAVLKAGRVPIRLDYFQGQAGRGLTVGWTGPGFSSRSLSTPLEAGRGKKKIDTTIAEAIKHEGERILGAEGKKDYDHKVAVLEKLKQEQLPTIKVLAVSEHGPKAPETFVLFRGNPHVQRDKVEPAFPSILKAKTPEIAPPAPNAKTSGRRTALARWLVSADNPLTARVLANRIWQHHFGRGIVRSSNNFGMLGDPPTHPELLDWLATELVANNWRLKPIHKMIMLSDVYRAASTGDPAAINKDPLNDSLWRFDMRRLTAEELRDSIHVTSGAFNPKMFGPGIFPDISKDVMAGQSKPGDGWGRSPPEEQARRSIYIHVKRSLITPIIADFDVADTDASCPVRFATTQPTQALGMMNGVFLQQQARVFAAKIRREAGGPNGDDTSGQVRRALELALTREVSAAEVAGGVALVDTLELQDGVSPGRAIELYCLMVLNLNEFAYLD